ncbi:hypothetical protein [Carboxylicivirga taeanensis]|uniref:hypothetical protein n=1 Tax=Carboxylicivirga taeanensis TaxID=1416875 RepID=UPI003F6DD06E
MKNQIKKYTKDLLQKVDEQDKGLSQQKRTIKWIVILGILFMLYVLSFMQSHLSLNHHLMKTLWGEAVTDSLGNDSTELTQSPFALPVDSFEQLLNQQIHEKAD